MRGQKIRCHAGQRVVIAEGHLDETTSRGVPSDRQDRADVQRLGFAHVVLHGLLITKG